MKEAKKRTESSVEEIGKLKRIDEVTKSTTQNLRAEMHDLRLAKAAKEKELGEKIQGLEKEAREARRKADLYKKYDEATTITQRRDMLLPQHTSIFFMTCEPLCSHRTTR